MRSFILILKIALFYVVISSGQLLAQTTETSGPMTIPIPPATTVTMGPGSVMIYRSGTEISILPQTDVQAGADVLFTIAADGGADANVNWILGKSFDAAGNVTGEHKSYFDGQGSLLQAQTHNMTANQFLASQPIYDQLGRAAINTLSAPTMGTTFAYKNDFVTNSTGGIYNYTNFDGTKLNAPDAVGNSVSGTLGWYYSNNNTLEPYVPATGYPYSRSDFYNDGTADLKRSGGIGESFKMGGGHESSVYTMPVNAELTHYLQVRNKFFTAAEIGAVPANLVSSAVQNVGRDENGSEGMNITSSNGAQLMAARPGAGGLTVANSVALQASTDIASTIPAIYYFKLMTATVVNITGSYALYNMSGNEAQMTFTSGGTLQPGYYKVVALTGAVTVAYSVGYTDINYNYYNQVGQLIATIPPEGVNKLLNGGLNSYATKSDIPFVTLSEYDINGRRRATYNKEQGRSEYVYRQDGRMRFSQNAGQRLAGTYAYSNYDQTGRIIETGEFKPTGTGVAFNINGMGIEENVNVDGGLGTGTKSYWVKTTYDVPVSTGLAGYVQDDIYLTGVTSYTENMAGAKTWFNYDEQGHLVWAVEDIPGLGKKTIDYSLNSLGQVTKVIFQKGTVAETFVHYYEYDADQRLAAVYTNTTDNTATRKLQAKYAYYIHGPLKRVELGGNVQGLDYTYTINGKLKAINHASKDLDPGKDGISGVNAAFAKDAFGLNLEYYNGDYTRSGTSINSIPLTTTVADDQFTGNIKGMGWYSRKPQSVITAMGAAIEDPTMYAYKYDRKYQLNTGTWGAPNYATPGFVASSAFKEYNLNYDAQGNILSLARTGSGGAVTDNFTYSYPVASNQLQTVTNGSTTYGSYAYNVLGQLATETPTGSPARYIKYDAAGKAVGVYADAAFTQPKVTFTYNEKGQRIIKKDFVNNNTVYYLPDGSGNVMAIYTQAGTGAISQAEVPLYAAGRIGIYRRGTALSEYELSDHLGNVRATIDQNRIIKQYADYYPFGSVLRDGGSLDYRYGFQGQYNEKDKETGWNAFELRMYDSRIARWLSTDPQAAERSWLSPYNFVQNNPVNRVDETGGIDDWVEHDGVVDYDSRVTNQKTAERYYGSKAIYHAPGYSYTAFGGENIILGNEGVLTSNGRSFLSPDMAVGKNYPAMANWAFGVVGAERSFRGSFVDVAELYAQGYRRNGKSFSNYKLEGRNFNLFKNKPMTEATKPINTLARTGKIIGTAAFVTGLVMDGIGVAIYQSNPSSPYAVHPAKAGLNTGMGALSLELNPLAGVLYFGMDAFYPGGWVGYANDYEGLQRENARINPGFITAPFGATKF